MNWTSNRLLGVLPLHIQLNLTNLQISNSQNLNQDLDPDQEVRRDQDHEELAVMLRVIDQDQEV